MLNINETKPIWHGELRPKTDNIVLDFVMQVEEPRDLGLGGLVIDHPSQTLHPNTNVYCDWFFSSIQGVERIMEKEMYVSGTVVKI